MPPGSKLLGSIVIFREAARAPLSTQYVANGESWHACNSSSQSTDHKVTLSLVSEKDGSAVTRTHASQGPSSGPRPPHIHAGCEAGSITAVGMKQAVSFGSYLKKRYLEPLRQVYPSSSSSSANDWLRVIAAKAITASKGRNKSLATLSGVLSGLFVGFDDHGSKEGDEGQTRAIQVLIPSHQKDEYLVPNSIGCKALGLMMRKMDHQIQLKAMKDSGDGGEGQRDAAMTVKMFLPELARGSNWISWKRLLDTLMSMEAHQITISPSSSGSASSLLESSNETSSGPWKVSSTLNDDESSRLYTTIDKEATLRVSAVLGPACNGITGTTLKQGVVLECQQLLKLSAGLMIGKLRGLLTNMTKEGYLGPRLHLFAAYDSTLFPLLAALGHKPKTWPPFMSSLAIEVWRGEAGEGGKEGEARVSVAWNGKTLPLAPVGFDVASSTRIFLGLEEFSQRVFAPYGVEDPMALRHECAAKVEMVQEGGPGEMHVHEVMGIQTE